MTGTPGRPSLAVSLAALLCFAPLLASLRSIGDPFGQTEEAVNAAIWALGGRNIKELGWREARLGAVVKPLWPQNGYIYAHHPPLPVWLSRFWMLFGKAEALPRLLGLFGLAAALWFLYRTLRLYLGESAALLALSSAALSVYATRYGRIFSTMTLATPFFSAALWLVLRRALGRERLHWALFALVPALVFSSWDGVLGAAAICAAALWLELIPHRPDRRPGRAVLLGATGLISIALLLAYFDHANGSLAGMVGLAKYRAGGELPWLPFLRAQFRFVRQGIGIWNILVCAAVMVGCVVVRRVPGLVRAALLASVPALGMTFLMRNGAYGHWFWAYNLILPLALLVGAAVEAVNGESLRARALTLLILGQGLANYALGATLLGEERSLNSVGRFFETVLPALPPGPVRVLAGYDFHPYLAWYGRRSHEIALSVPELRARIESRSWTSDDLVLVDTRASESFGCRVIVAEQVSPARRWILAKVGAVAQACSIQGR